MRLFLIKLYTDHWRYFWSKLRHARSLKSIACFERVRDIEHLQSVLDDMMAQFQYRADGLSRLFDSMDSPAQCYYNAANGKLVDDCDGFHACIYWILKANGHLCRIFTIMTGSITDSHSILVAEFPSGRHFIDYDVITPFKDYEDLIRMTKLEAYGTEDKKYLYTCFSKWENDKWQADNNYLPGGPKV